MYYMIAGLVLLVSYLIGSISAFHAETAAWTSARRAPEMPERPICSASTEKKRQPVRF